MGIVQRKGASLTIISYIGAFIGYINRVILMPVFMTQAMIGLASVIVSMGSVFAQIAAFGMPSITMKFFPFFKDENKRHNGFFVIGQLVTIIGFVIAAIVFLLFNQPIASIFSQKSSMVIGYIYYVIPLGFATVIYNYYDTYLRSIYDLVFSSFVYEIILRVLITLSIILYAIGVIDFHHFIVVYVIANCSPAIFVLIYIIYIREFYFKLEFTNVFRRLRKFMIDYGIFSYLGAFSLVFFTQIDTILVTGMLGLDNAGVYAVIVNLISMILIPYRAMGKVAAPIVSEHWKNKDMIKLADVYRKFSLNNLIVCGMIFILLWINIDSVLSLKPEYLVGKYVFLFLGLARVFDAYTGLNGFILTTSKKYRYDLFFTFGLIAVTLVLYILLIPVFQINGAALAAMLTIFIYNLGRLFLVKYFFKIHPFQWKDFVIFCLGVFIIVLNEFTGKLSSALLDVCVRSTVVLVVFIGPIYYFKLSEDFNSMIHKTINIVLKKTNK